MIKDYGLKEYGLKACNLKPGFVSQLNMYQNTIGVAEWKNQMVSALPEELKSSLPAIEELEKELE